MVHTMLRACLMSWQLPCRRWCLGRGNHFSMTIMAFQFPMPRRSMTFRCHSQRSQTRTVEKSKSWTCPTRFVLFCPFWDFPFISGISQCSEDFPNLRLAAKGVRQKEFGKKVTAKVTEASEKVTKSDRKNPENKKSDRTPLRTSFCGTLKFQRCTPAEWNLCEIFRFSHRF